MGALSNPKELLIAWDHPVVVAYPWCCTGEPGWILGLRFFLPPVAEEMRHVIQPCSGES